MSSPASYFEIHWMLKEQRGFARDHLCSCGQPAVDWAYQYTGDPELWDEDGRRPHSANVEDYAPMCRSCHVRLDAEHAGGKAPRMEGWLAAGRKAGQKRAERMAADPIFAEQIMEPFQAGANKRRRCDDCGFESTPAGISHHQRASGHTGYEESN